MNISSLSSPAGRWATATTERARGIKLEKGMTLQDAIKSGKSFKRRQHKFWIFIRDGIFYVEPETQTFSDIITCTLLWVKNKKKLESGKWMTGKLSELKLTPVVMVPRSVLAKDWITRK
jgi:hypothetical protein